MTRHGCYVTVQRNLQFDTVTGIMNDFWMSFLKLDCGILDSTLWPDREARELFITGLLMAKPKRLEVPMAQIEVRTLLETGFFVPPGEYGFIAAAGTGIIRRAGMDEEQGLAALERLGAPDLESRTPDFEGRRLIRVSGGYIALNYQHYRDKDHTAAVRAKRYRQNKANRRSQKSVRLDNQSRERRYVAAESRGDINAAEVIAAEELNEPKI